MASSAGSGSSKPDSTEHTARHMAEAATTMSQRQGFQGCVRPATPADVPDIVRIHFAAFAGSPMWHLLYPDGITDAVRDGFSKIFFPADVAPGPGTDPSSAEQITMVAELVPSQTPAGAAASGAQGQDKNSTVNEAKGQIVGYAKWEVVRLARTEEKWNVDEPPQDRGKGVDKEVFEAFIGDLKRMRRRWTKGDPHLVLDILAVDPQFMRRGVGSALLSWGTALADEARWFTWLESTPVGYPVYIGYGFEAVDTHDLEIVKRFGALRREGEDWGETTALEVLGPLPPGHFRTPMLRRAPR